jgi:hypothetical protein
MGEEVPRFLPVPLKFEDKRGEKMGQEAFTESRTSGT